jgi:hypothetical protein
LKNQENARAQASEISCNAKRRNNGFAFDSRGVCSAQSRFDSSNQATPYRHSRVPPHGDHPVRVVSSVETPSAISSTAPED